MAAVGHVAYYAQTAYYATTTAAISCSRTAPSSAAAPSAPPASPRARRASRPRWPATRRRSPTRATSRRCSASPTRSSATTASTRRGMESERVQCEGVVMRDAAPGVGGAGSREQGVVALDERRHARARPADPRRTASLRCALGEAPVEELHARALAEPPIDGRPLDRQRRHDRAVLRRRRPARRVVDLGCKRSIPRAARRRPGSRCYVVPGDWDADAILETQPQRRAGRQRPGRPGRARRPDRDGPRPARPRAALRHLPRPPAARARARPARRSSCRSATAARTTPCATLRTGRVLVTVQNHGFAVAAADDELVSHVSLNDGTVRGPRRRRTSRACSSIPRPRPGRSTPCPSSTGSPTRAEARPTFARS